MAPFDSERFPLPRPIPEGHRRLEDFGFQIPQKEFAPAIPVEAPVTDDVLRVLIEGRRLIAEPQHWVQGPFAVNEACRSVSVSSSGAVSFCSVGAIRRAAINLGFREHGNEKITAKNCLTEASGQESCIYYNDARGRTHAEVMGMWNRAIAARRAEQEQASMKSGEATP